MWYGYKLNDQQDWTKMKNFDSLEDYYNYIEKHHVNKAMCSNKEIDLRGRALITGESYTIRDNPYTKSRESE